MDYVIECRPSGQFIEALSRAELHELSRLFGSLVFFARNISCADGPGRDDVEPLVNEAINEVLKSLPPWIRIDTGRIDVYEGSVTIVIFVSVVALPVAGPVVGGFAVGGLALWAADHFFGGALETFGREFATGLIGRIKEWWKRTGQPPHPTTIINPREIADGEAQRVAAQHGCRPALLTGGTSNSVQAHLYEYTYQLYECGHRLLTIKVDSQSIATPVHIVVD